MFKMMKNITGDNLESMHRATAFTVLESLFVVLPYAVIYYVVLMIYQNTVTNDCILWSVAVISALFVIRTFFALLSHTRTMESGYLISSKIRVRLGEHMRKLSLGFFSGKDLGKLSNAILQDVELVDMIFSHIYVKVVGAITVPLFTAILLFTVDVKMSLVMCATVPLALPFMFFGKRILKNMGSNRLDIIDRTNSAILEYLSGIKIIKSFNLMGKNFTKLDRLFSQLSNESIRIERIATAAAVAYSAVIETGFILLIIFGSYMVASGSLDAPDFILFLIISLKFYRPFFEFIMYFSLMGYMQNAGRRIETVVDEEILSSGNNEKTISGYDIVFDDVSFKYREKGTLHNVSFSVPQNSMTALVGASGSGKTTITNLIARFWDVNSGGIFVGGTDIREIDPDRLLSDISIVFQDVYLFNDTVINNIKIGNPAATGEEVVAAARKALCDDFIMAMPQGYNSLVGEGGTTLSGGEKQRISIARAILKDAPVVLLDEATASLDPENERLVQEAISELVATKTVIVIAHHLNTIVQADSIIVLNNGRIEQTGTHEELLLNPGIYKDLWIEGQESESWKIRR